MNEVSFLDEKNRDLDKAKAFRDSVAPSDRVLQMCSLH
jgi:hypothetical protein